MLESALDRSYYSMQNPRTTNVDATGHPATPESPSPRSTRAESAVQNATLPSGDSGQHLPSGTEFGRYRIERLLGEGVMGAVYLAHDTQLTRSVALKIPKFDSGDAEAKARFLREARSAAVLRHPNICPIHDVGEVNGRQYLTMAYIDGRPLSDFISPGKPVPPRSAASVIRKLALGLAEAHAADIVHRDLKSANVMVDRKSEPIVMDFGLARSFGDKQRSRLTQTGTIIGSPSYMSPEQVQDDASRIGPCSDIYSLGVILFELLTARLPFEGTLMAVLGALLTQDAPTVRQFRPEIDPALEAICSRMMAKRPEQRYAKMKDVAEALKAWLASTPSGPANLVSAASIPGSVSASAVETPRLMEKRLDPRMTMMEAVPNRVPQPSEPQPSADSDKSRGAWKALIADRWLAGTISAGALVCGLVILGIFLASRNQEPDPSPPAAPPGASPSVSIVAPVGEPEVPGVVSSISRTESNSVTPRNSPTNIDVTGPNDEQPIQTVVHVNSIGMKFVRIPAGEYLRGAPDSDEDASSDEQPRHPVRITREFFLGATEVTQRDWKEVIGTEPWKGNDSVDEADECAATYVNWHDANVFCNRLARLDGRTYRLPTEAEWELACRAGTTTRYSFSDDAASLKKYAWFSENTLEIGSGEAQEVGQKKANPFGLFDMHGNVWEWCADHYDDYAVDGNEPISDPRGPESGDLVVLRSGSVEDDGASLRSSQRHYLTPTDRAYNVGFRVVLVPTSPP